tara:strand:+ start:87 stop:317 length:231 start_codon:yes stop_codon:yes gene_type:complete
MFLQQDWSNVKERKQIIVEVNKNPYWPGYGDVEVLSEGSNGYTSFKTHQEDPIHYAIMRKLEQPEYELIINDIVIK